MTERSYRGDWDRFIACMDHVRASGVDWPQLRGRLSTGEVVRFARMQDGSVFVGGEERERGTGYAVLRRALEPVWLPRARRMPPDAKAALWALLRALATDPEAALVEMGRHLGRCVVCNHPISSPESRARGNIGPECWKRLFG